MSGEYYCNEEPITKFYKEYENNSPKSVSNKENYESKSQDVRLHDIEDQLEMAENRCNTLKDQLDYMKQIYGVNKNALKSRKISNIASFKKPSEEKLSGSSLTDETNEKETKASHPHPHPKRQNSNAISTDNTGAAVRTINNIINGITDSVNRLSELHVQISESPRNRRVRSTGISPHPVIEIDIEKSRSDTDHTEAQKNFTDESGVLQDNILGSSTGISSKSKNIRRKIKEGKLLNKKPVASLQSIRRSTKLEKRNKNNSAKSSVMDKNVSPMMKRRFLHSLKPNAQTHKLIEIYHNTAAKNSDSDDGHPQKSRQKRRLNAIQIRRYPENSGKSYVTEIPPLNISEKPELISSEPANDINMLPLPQFVDIQTVAVDNFEPLQAPRTEITTYSKNYELPTIASRMKQVAKSYLNSFNFKAIPFCAAISTSPSHNIGINIQQVMNILKTRQPINGISPTLAHNIGLAADRLNSRPLSALVSTINSRTGYRSSRCPLSKTILNYQQLQEMAKGIPEETAEEMEEAVDSPAMKTLIITGPSGDMEVKNRNIPVWAVDPSQSDQCTCIPQSGVEFQHVVNKYRRNVTPLTAKTIESQMDNRLVKYNVTKRKPTQKKVLYSKNGYTTSTNFSTVNTENQEVVEQNPLQGKERNLKEVLTNLHDEFESLNKRYEEVAQKANAEDEVTLRELENMEAELNKKEEEITMVMTLYKEVLALKQQVKSLKQRTSQASVNIQDQKESATIKYKEYNNPQAAFHLTKLLRQIQHYQMRYKRDVSGV